MATDTNTNTKSDDLDPKVRAICIGARKASRKIGPKGRDVKDAALEAIARNLEAGEREVIAANEADLEAARAKGTTGAMLASCSTSGASQRWPRAFARSPRSPIRWAR
jgi:hypothetical protein